MSRRITKAELQAENARIRAERDAYQEAFWALQRGERPVQLESGPYRVTLLGAGRACGGVVVEGPSATMAGDWSRRVAGTTEPYLRALALEVSAAQKRAIEQQEREVACQKTIGHYVDNQGLCHNCGTPM